MMISWGAFLVFIALTYHNRRDEVKFNTCLLFAIVHFFNSVTTFSGALFFYSTILASLTLLLYPSLRSQRDWAVLLSVILLSSILVDIVGIIAYKYSEFCFCEIIDFYKKISTAFELLILTAMSHGRLDAYKASDTAKRIQSHARVILSRTNLQTSLARGF